MKRLLPLLILVACTQQVEPPVVEPVSAVKLLREQHKEELTDWAKLILAISYTESRFNPDALGKAGDSGHLQLLPIYIAEVNRVAGTSYTIEDAFDIDRSIEIFQTMQLFKNPERNLEKAVFYHNKSPYYLKTVMENYQLICRMEEVRAKLIEK